MWSELADTALWADALEIPDALTSTLRAREGFREVGALLAEPQVRRIVATGNGASYYVAHALWLASLADPQSTDVVAVPAGILAANQFEWRNGDRLLVVSSSGELRDAIDVTRTPLPLPYVLVTSCPDSTLGAGAAANAVVHLTRQSGLVHTQAYLGNLVTLLALWAELRRDARFADEIATAPELAAASLELTQDWLSAVAAKASGASAAIVFGTGHAWPAALEAALLLKELARMPAEGVETREGATSAAFGLTGSSLALSLPTTEDDALVIEAEAVCRSLGATIVRTPTFAVRDPRLHPVGLFAPCLALAIAVSHERSHDVDNPVWAEAYLGTTRAPDDELGVAPGGA